MDSFIGGAVIKGSSTFRSIFGGAVEDYSDLLTWVVYLTIGLLVVLYFTGNLSLNLSMPSSQERMFLDGNPLRFEVGSKERAYFDKAGNKQVKYAPERKIEAPGKPTIFQLSTVENMKGKNKDASLYAKLIGVKERLTSGNGCTAPRDKVITQNRIDNSLVPSNLLDYAGRDDGNTFYNPIVA